jgi:ribonuclease D
MTESMSPPIWLRTPEQLMQAVDRWMHLDAIALDTEFMRVRTYYSLPGLIQIADDDAVYLIDPLEVTDLTPLKPLLVASTPLKIIHSMTEDVLLLEHLLGTVPHPVYDTQIAGNFLGASDSQGFQSFVQAQLGVELDKSETRSDWLARPLSEAQIRYAVQDVYYLLRAYRRQLQQIVERGWHDAVMEECDSVLKQILRSEHETDLAYLKLRGAWDLNPLQQRILKPLVCWRDELARSKNLPKSWVCEDQVLIEIARLQAGSPEALHRVKGLKEAAVRRHGEAIMECVQQALDAKDIGSFIRVDRPVHGIEMQIYRELKMIVEKQSEAQRLAMSLLGPKRHLEQLIFHYLRFRQDSLTPYFSGWRRSIVGDALLQCLRTRQPPKRVRV